MIVSLTGTNIYTNDVCDLYADGFEVNHFAWTPTISGSDAKRGQSPGRFKNYKQPEHLAIDIAGAVLDNDPTSFWTNRDLFTKCFIPDPLSDTRDHIVLEMVRDDGTSDHYFASVVLDSWSFPLEALYPAVAKFDLGFDCRDAYWRIGSADGDLVRI